MAKRIETSADARARAAARARARELERAGHTGLARAFRAFADGRTDGRSLTLTDYLDPPDVAAANAARADDALSDAHTRIPGFSPASAHPGADDVGARDAGAGADDVSEPDPDA